jgi:hypothetical protein
MFKSLSVRGDDMTFMILPKDISYRDVKLKGKADKPCQYVEKRIYDSRIRKPCKKACKDCSYRTKGLPAGCAEFSTNRYEEDALGLPAQGWDAKSRAWMEIEIPQEVV